MKAGRGNALKRRNLEIMMIGLFMILAAPFLFYYGYCWGWWGRHSLLLQHYFQCQCPAASEESRYPEEEEVMISACRDSNVRLSPGGRLLSIDEKDSHYVLNLQTGQKTDISHQSYSMFLTDDLGFIQYPEPYLVDRASGLQYPILLFRYSRPDGQVNGKTNLPLLAENLQQAENIYFIEDQGVVVAVANDFRSHLRDNYFFDRFDLLNTPMKMEQFLQENEIKYESIPANFPEKVTSPDGRFFASHEGIFLMNNDKKIVEGIPHMLVRGWMYNSSGVIYTSHFLKPCLLWLSYPMADDSWCEIRVPQPVLLVRLPKEFLVSTESP